MAEFNVGDRVMNIQRTLIVEIQALHSTTFTGTVVEILVPHKVYTVGYKHSMWGYQFFNKQDPFIGMLRALDELEKKL